MPDGRVYQFDGLYWKPPGLGSIGFDTQRAGAQSSAEELRFLETGLLQVRRLCAPLMTVYQTR